MKTEYKSFEQMVHQAGQSIESDLRQVVLVADGKQLTDELFVDHFANCDVDQDGPTVEQVVSLVGTMVESQLMNLDMEHDKEIMLYKGKVHDMAEANEKLRESVDEIEASTNVEIGTLENTIERLQAQVDYLLRERFNREFDNLD